MATERTWPDVAIPPGEFLAGELDGRGLPQAELARRTKRPVQAINEIVRGKKVPTPEMALQLERVLGIPASIWGLLEADDHHQGRAGGGDPAGPASRAPSAA